MKNSFGKIGEPPSRGIDTFGELDEKGEAGNLAAVGVAFVEAAGDKKGDEVTFLPILR